MAPHPLLALSAIFGFGCGGYCCFYESRRHTDAGGNTSAFTPVISTPERSPAMRDTTTHPITPTEIIECLDTLAEQLLSEELIGDMRPLLLREAARAVRRSPNLWRPIATAAHDPDAQVLLAKFSHDHDCPDYVVSAHWGTDMPGHTDLASYSGWFVDPVPLMDPPRHRRNVTVTFGILARDEWAPTHWLPTSKISLDTDKIPV